MPAFWADGSLTRLSDPRSTFSVTESGKQPEVITTHSTAAAGTIEIDVKGFMRGLQGTSSERSE